MRNYGRESRRADVFYHILRFKRYRGDWFWRQQRNIMEPACEREWQPTIPHERKASRFSYLGGWLSIAKWTCKDECSLQFVQLPRIYIWRHCFCRHGVLCKAKLGSQTKSGVPTKLHVVCLWAGLWSLCRRNFPQFTLFRNSDQWH